MPNIRFQDLRHTCATFLLGKGVHAEFVQELLGRSTITITLDTYSHVLPSMGNAAAGAMGEALGKRVGVDMVSALPGTLLCYCSYDSPAKAERVGFEPTRRR